MAYILGISGALSLDSQAVYKIDNGLELKIEELSTNSSRFRYIPYIGYNAQKGSNPHLPPARG